VADIQIEGNARDLEEECKVLASCAYEENTQWGIEVSLSLSLPLPPSPSLSLAQRSWMHKLIPLNKGFKFTGGFEVWLSTGRWNDRILYKM
jgi:hypothetical protein